MKLTEKQKERYRAACKDAICRCLIPNVTKITLILNNLKRPTLRVFTRPASGEGDFHIDVVLTDTNSMRLYFKKVKFLYGEAIIGISLETSIHFDAHVSRIIDLLLEHDDGKYRDFSYEFSAMPGHMELTIDSKNWHSLDNSDDLRFAPIDLDHILNEDGD